MSKYLKIILGIGFIAFVVWLLKFSPLNYYLFTEEGKAIFDEKFAYYMKKLGFWAPVIFIFCYAASVMVFLPASIFTSIGGMVFGNWLGLFLNVIGALLGGIVSFFMARYLFRGAASKFLEKGHFKKLDDKAAEHGFSIILYLRLMFIPYTYLNFAASLSRIKFKDFFLGTLFGVIPSLAVVTFLAAAVKELFLIYKSPMDLVRLDIIIPFILFILSFFIPTVMKHYKNKFNITKEIEEEVGEEG